MTTQQLETAYSLLRNQKFDEYVGTAKSLLSTVTSSTLGEEHTYEAGPLFAISMNKRWLANNPIYIRCKNNQSGVWDRRVHTPSQIKQVYIAYLKEYARCNYRIESLMSYINDIWSGSKSEKSLDDIRSLAFDTTLVTDKTLSAPLSNIGGSGSGTGTDYDDTELREEITKINTQINALSSQAMTQIATNNAALKQVQTNQGTIANLSTKATNIVDAINEVNTNLNSVDHSAYALKTDVTTSLAKKVDTTTLDKYMLKTDIQAADTSIKNTIGTLSSLTTTKKDTIVNAINELDADTVTLEQQHTVLQANIDKKLNITDFNNKVDELKLDHTTLEQSIKSETARATTEEQRLQNEMDAKTKAAAYNIGTKFNTYDFVIHANKIYLVGQSFTATGNFTNDSVYLVALQDDDSNLGVVTYSAGISIKNGQTVLHNTDDGGQELYICTQDIDNTTTWDVDSTKMVSYGASINLDNYYNKSEVDAMLARKMDLLSQGEGVVVTRSDTAITVSADMSTTPTANKIMQRDSEGSSTVNMPNSIISTTIVNNKYLNDTLTTKLADYALTTDLDSYATLVELAKYVPSTTYTAKVTELEQSLATKQETLTAGDNIVINNGIISGTAAYDDSELRTEIAKKQDTLVAGTGITIDSTTNTISSTMTGIQVVDTLPTTVDADTIYFVRAYN